ncbi:MAG: hypothetical protein DMF33_07405 [Verrucomicrobia bacterium]|nr:MAG: hypothetical protein DMF33_07405 [Verrucomicrobiota bacterium]
MARCLKSARRGHRAGRAKDARFYDEESARRFPAAPRNRRDRGHTRRGQSEQPRHLPRGHRNDRAAPWPPGDGVWNYPFFRSAWSRHRISAALVNTAAGLAIGIPAMMFYAFFRGRAQKLISELEAATTHVLALLSLQYGRRGERTPVLIEEEL